MTRTARSAADDASARSGPTEPAGFLIVNADDWGREAGTTNAILACRRHGVISAASAMVFMDDSARAATLAREHGLDAGLHLNFTTPFSAAACPPALRRRQDRLRRYLRSHRLAQAVFHPGLVRAFEYVVRAQMDEFARLYGAEPDRIDGHHHMHLCANVLWQRLLPRGTLVRRNFSFTPGEKGRWNRLYRRSIDRALARRHDLVEHFFSLAPLDGAGRLPGIIALARRGIVEIETHPVEADEYAFLTEGRLLGHAATVPILPPSRVPRRQRGRAGHTGREGGGDR